MIDLRPLFIIPATSDIMSERAESSDTLKNDYGRKRNIIITLCMPQVLNTTLLGIAQEPCE